jgi:hypothetical protein
MAVGLDPIWGMTRSRMNQDLVRWWQGDTVGQNRVWHKTGATERSDHCEGIE